MLKRLSMAFTQLLVFWGVVRWYIWRKADCLALCPASLSDVSGSFLTRESTAWCVGMCLEGSRGEIPYPKAPNTGNLGKMALYE